MGFDRSTLGILSPFVAVVGDLALALLIAFGVVVPGRLFTRRISRGLERRAWAWCLGDRGLGWVRAAVRTWLEHRLRFAVRLRAARYSLPAALSRGLQIGLPLAAIIAATVPVWGMSWYFDTENWAAGHLELLGRGAHRHLARGHGPAVCQGEPRVGADGVRRARRRASPTGRTSPSSSSATRAKATPRSTSCATSCSRWRRREDVRFVVHLLGRRLSHRRDEGLRGEVLAAVQGHRPSRSTPSRATTIGTTRSRRSPPRSSTPDAARAAMRARIEADNRLTSTTDRRIDELIAEAGALRAASTVCRRGSSRRRSSRSRPRLRLFCRRHRRDASASTPSSWRGSQAALDARARQADDGDPRPSVLRGRPRLDRRATTSSSRLHRLLREHDVTS